MSSRTAKLDPLDELRLVAEPEPDRLPAMLFLAALFHGILILGISFSPALLDDFADAISLEVTIVADPDQRIDRPDNAGILAEMRLRLADWSIRTEDHRAVPLPEKGGPA